MPADNPRIIELRRRVHADPASPAFAQLAEECRRAGETDEAVGACRAGLVHHPDNVAARVTLGRALVELGRLDEAFTELTQVLDAVPGNLPAIRALAEIYQRRGLMSEALVHYRRALELAQHDSDLEQTVETMKSSLEPATPPAEDTGKDPVTIEELFDFDSLLAQLGTEPSAAPEPGVPDARIPARWGGEPMFRPLVVEPPVQSPIQAIELTEDADDSFAAIERQLREFEEQRAKDERLAREVEAERRRLLVMQELEEWLSAIVADRRPRQTA